MKPLVVRPAAERDILDAFRWYEERRAGLGDELLLALGGAMDQIVEAPRTAAIVHRDVRRVLLRRFPYLVYFRERSDRLEVIAVLHARREARAWQVRR